MGVEAEHTVVAWYQDDLIHNGLIDSPVDLAHDAALSLGDLYYHRTPAQYQLWLWTMGQDGPWWKPVTWGHVREDGKRLIVTKLSKWPSWVSESYYRSLNPE